MKQRIYIDTSVIGGCLDEIFQEASNKLIDKIKKGEVVAVVSELTLLELTKAPFDVKNVLKNIPEQCIEYVELEQESLSLAQNYIKVGVVDEDSYVDAQHIAIATINHVDVVVSWNFKHIVYHLNTSLYKYAWAHKKSRERGIF